MHASSLENMQKCYERYICGEYFQARTEISVLDIGGANVNGSYADIFSSKKFRYIGADIAPGDGIDLVLKDPYKLPLDADSIDVIVSGQAFEHVEFFWQLFEEMVRVVNEDGWIILIAPSGGPIHRYPVDCYRFYPDAYSALAKYTGINLVSVHHDDRGPWRDLVGVFSKAVTQDKPLPPDWHPVAANEMNRHLAERIPVDTRILPQGEELERTQGKLSYLEVLKALHQVVRPSLYFEIGVRKGNSLSLASCDAIAVDPEPDLRKVDYPNVDLYKMPSDYFFERHWRSGGERSNIDLAFIDGMHLFEFVLRDFINIEENASKQAVVVVDDVFPNHPAQATRKRETQVWTGDVWRFLVCLMEARPDLQLTLLDTSPTGLLLIRGLNSNNRVLVNQYNPLIRKFLEAELESYTDLLIDRKRSLSPDSEEFRLLLSDIGTRSGSAAG